MLLLHGMLRTIRTTRK